MKFIITGDLHFKTANPRSRKDIYVEALEAKLMEVFDLAENHNATAILIPGDIFDSPTVSLPTVISLARTLRVAPCAVITIPGNHDVYAHNLDSVPRTPYGLLRDLGYIRCVHGNSFMFAGPVDGLITGHGFNNETDNDFLQYGISTGMTDINKGICNTLPRESGEYLPFYIHMVHGMLLDKSPGIEMRHTLVSQLADLPEERQPNILVCGHYHLGLGIKRVGKTLIINPGALGRLTAHVEEIERTVQVALLEINSVDDYNAKFIPLKMAQPGHEILSREHLEKEAERNERLEEFLALLASEGESKFLEVRDIIEDIAARENISRAVKDAALGRIARAREQLGA